MTASAPAKDLRSFRPGVQSYLVLLFVPALLLGLGLADRSVIHFGLAEYTVFFAAPLLAVTGVVIFLGTMRLDIDHDGISFTRLKLRMPLVETVSIAKADIIHATAMNSFGQKKKLERETGLRFVPVSVLHIEYREAGMVKHAAVNIANYDKTALKAALKEMRGADARKLNPLPGF